MKIEVGKRYVRRDGEISGVITPDKGCCLPFWDEVNQSSYTITGRYWIGGGIADNDLIKEYNEEDKIMKDYTLIEHIKGNNGNYVGTLVAVTGHIPYEYVIGWAKFNNKLEPKTSSKEMKRKGLEIAMGRANSGRPLFNITKTVSQNFPYSFASKIDKFIERCKRYYKTDAFPNNMGR